MSSIVVLFGSCCDEFRVFSFLFDSHTCTQMTNRNMDRWDFACCLFWSNTGNTHLPHCTRTCTGACDMHNKRSKMPKFQSGQNNMYCKLFTQLLLTSSKSFDVVFFSHQKIYYLSSLLFENCPFAVFNNILWDVTHLLTRCWVFHQIIFW